MEKKIVVPEGMLKAVKDGFDRAYGRGAQFGDYPGVCAMLALQWLSENPIVPTKEQWDDLRRTCWVPDELQAVEWQRRMFLAPEPEPEKALQDLFFPEFVDTMDIVNGRGRCTRTEEKYRESVIEAYRRGQKSK